MIYGVVKHQSYWRMKSVSVSV